MFEVDEVIAEFLVESHENLDQLDRDLVALEREPGNRDLVASIFRTIHTIKGTCGFLAFHQLEAVTHAGENLLARIRDGKLELDAERANVLLAMVDVVRTLLGEIEATGAEGDHDHSALVGRINASMEATSPTAVVSDTAATSVETESLETQVPADESGDLVVTAPSTNPVESQLEAPKPAARAKRATRAKSAAKSATATVEVAQVEAPVTAHAPEAHAEESDEHDAAKHDADGRRSVADSTLRVDVDLLDTLMRLVGELVLTRNQLLANSSQMDAGMIRATQRLNLIASELQEGVMKTRM